MPLLAGDRLTLHYSETTSGEAEVLGTEGGRVRVLVSGGGEAIEFDRARFTTDSGRTFAAGDIGVVRRESSWERAEVMHAEPRGQVRLRGLGVEQAREQIVAADSFLRLQHPNGTRPSYAPLPPRSAVLAGDLVAVREQNMIVVVRVIESLPASDTVLTQSGVADSDGHQDRR